MCVYIYRYVSSTFLYKRSILYMLFSTFFFHLTICPKMTPSSMEILISPFDSHMVTGLFSTYFMNHYLEVS